MDDKDQAEFVEWRKCATDSNVTRINILAGRIALTRDDALHIAGAQDYDAVKAQNIAYREALEKILAATNDPWGNSQHTIAGICNEALGNHPI